MSTSLARDLRWQRENSIISQTMVNNAHGLRTPLFMYSLIFSKPTLTIKTKDAVHTASTTLLIHLTVVYHQPNRALSMKLETSFEASLLNRSKTLKDVPLLSRIPSIMSGTTVCLS